MGTVKLTDRQKLNAVLEGIKGKPVADICTSYEILQAQYYRYRDQFFAHAEESFKSTSPDSKERRLLAENQKLKQCVAELTLEIKKNEEW